MGTSKHCKCFKGKGTEININIFETMFLTETDERQTEGRPYGENPRDFDNMAGWRVNVSKDLVK